MWRTMTFGLRLDFADASAFGGWHPRSPDACGACLSQADLAERADVSRQTLMSIEGGALSIRFADVARLLWVLDDVALQTALASAAQDAVYQEPARTSLPRSKRRGKGEA
jgi:transcriptional regulator with XRE-family HTH domain